MELREMRTFWSLLKQHNLDLGNARPLLVILACSKGRRCVTTEIGIGLICSTMIVLWMILFPPAATSRQDSWPASNQHRPIFIESGQSRGFSRTLAQ